MTVSAAAVLALAGCGDGNSRETASGGAPQPRISRSAIEESLAAAEAYFQANDLPKAEAILLTLIDRAPGEAAAHELHGQVLLAHAADARADGNVNRARTLLRRAYERYEKVIEHAPPSAGLHHSAGDVAAMAGLNERALAHYQEAMRLDPTQPRHAIFAAQVLAQAQRFDEARAALRDALALDPDEPIAHASLANIAIQEERFEHALAHIREARSIQPESAAFRVIEATVHRKAGNPRRALEVLIGLPRNEQARRSVAHEMAESYAAIGEHESAAEAWMHCFRANPDDPDAWQAAVSVSEQLAVAGRRADADLWLTQAKVAGTRAGDVDEAARRIAEVEARLGE